MPREFVRVEGLKGVVDTLRQLPPEVVSKRGGPVRSSLRKAAKVLQVQAQLNVQAIIDAPNKGDLPTESTGLLKKSIVIARGKQPASGRGETQLVKIKRGAKYPGKFQDAKGSITAAKVGRLLEEGSEKRAPMPWLRPAFDAKKYEALTVFATTLLKGIEVIKRKLMQRNGVKR